MKCEIRYKRGTQVQTLTLSGTEERSHFRMEAAAMTAALAREENGALCLK